MRPTPTHCPYCALRCDTLVEAGTVTPREDAPAGAAPYGPGRGAGELLCASDRLTVPLMRPHRNAPMRPVSGGAALDRIAAEVRRIQRAAGFDAVAVLGGGGLTEEKAYQLGKFARVALSTANIDYNGRSRVSSAAAAQTRAFGLDRGLPVPATDVADADAILLAGGDVAETMPRFARQQAAQRGGGGTLIELDPRRAATARQADLHLQPTPGTDLALANGLLHLAMTEGLSDEAYVRRRTSGFATVRAAVGAYPPERVERITGVPVARLREAVRLLGLAPRALILTARGEERHAAETDTDTAFINQALGLGLTGRAGFGFGFLTGQGGREYGQRADRLPGHRRNEDPAAREHVARDR